MAYRISNLVTCEVCGRSVEKSETYFDARARSLCRTCHARDEQARLDDFRQGTEMDRRIAAANDTAWGAWRIVRLCIAGFGLLMFLSTQFCK